MSEITRDKVTGESEVMQWRQVLCNTGCLGGVEDGVEDKKGGYTVASSPGFSLLPRNSLRMTFDPPERKAEGEPGPFSHVIDDA